MELTVEKFADVVQGFRQKSDPERVRLLVWFIHRAMKQERVNTKDIRACYDLLHFDIPNISEILRRHHLKKPAVLLNDSRGFYMEGSCRATLDNEYLALVEEPKIEVHDLVLPVEMVKGTKPYIETMAYQINGSYQFKFYDGCCVMMRRLMESLLIEALVKAGAIDKIRDGNAFKQLGAIIAITTGGQYIKLSRGLEKVPEEIKYIGDRAAHHRMYVSLKRDVSDHINSYRTLVAELLNRAALK